MSLRVGHQDRMQGLGNERGQKKFEVQSRGWQTFSVKVWRVNLLGFVSHKA